MEADTHGVKMCDGCDVEMDFETYQNHNCPAYKGLPHKNPLAHKMSTAKWMTPKGTLIAKGSCLTKVHIAAAHRDKLNG